MIEILSEYEYACMFVCMFDYVRTSAEMYIDARVELGRGPSIRLAFQKAQLRME